MAVLPPRRPATRRPREPDARRRHLAQEGHRVDDPAGVLGRGMSTCWRGGRRPPRRWHRIRPAPRSVRVGDPVAEHEAHPRARCGPVTGHHVRGSRYSGCRSASSRPARDSGRGSPPCDPGAPAGRRRRVRSGPPPRPAPACRSGGGRGQRPAGAEGQIAEETLNRVDRDRAVQLGTVADVLAGVVADPPVDWPEADCRRPAGARLLVVAVADEAEHAWMFSPAGQPALQGGRRST